MPTHSGTVEIVMREELKPLQIQAGNVSESVFNAYSSVLFGDNALAGLLMFAATLREPVTGMGGFVGTLVTVLLSRIMGIDVWESRKGYYGFNSLLTTLGVTHITVVAGLAPAVCILVAGLVAVFTFYIFLFIESIAFSLFKMSSLSFTFSIVSIIVYTVAMHLLPTTSAHALPSAAWEGYLPEFARFYLATMGSLLFMSHIVSGILISLALIVISRIAWFFSVAGALIAYLYLRHYTGGVLDTPYHYLGINVMLIMIALSGIYVLPGIWTILFALLAALGGAFLFSALQPLFMTLGIPQFTFSFVLTVLVFLHVLKSRMKNRNPYLIDFGIFVPEKSLEYFQAKIDRFTKVGTPQFVLPFSGEWVVTQGNKGEITHQRFWAYAWDFEIMDTAGKTWADNPLDPTEYFCYGKTVSASADGSIARMVDTIPDNVINQINTYEKWGNYIVISHGNGIFSLYGHLKAGSVRVAVGDYVKLGDPLARVGNSGRSAVPHLHFNIQQGVEPGSRTVFAHFVNFKSRRAVANYQFNALGTPRKGEFVSPLVPHYPVQQLLHLSLSDEQRFLVKTPRSTFQECWKIVVNLYGNFAIESDAGCRLEFSIYRSTFNVLTFSGNRTSALFGFAVLVSRLPYTEKGTVAWNDAVPYATVMNPVLKNSMLLVSTMYTPIKVQASSRMVQQQRLAIQTETTIRLFGKMVTSYQGEVEIIPGRGVIKINLVKNQKKYLIADNVR